jgi:membrane-associated phospholipid phosphatase
MLDYLWVNYLKLVSLPLVRWILVFIFIPHVALSQGDTLRKRPDVLRFADGVLYTATAPGRWQGDDWLVLGGVVAATAALLAVDEPVHRFWVKQDSPFLDGVERIGYHYGKPYSAVAFTAGFYFAGLMFKNPHLRETGLLLGTSLITSGFVQTIMKDAVGRARPDTGVGNFSFKPFGNEPAYHSFPSGHSAVAFAISLVIARRTEYVPVKIFFYALSATTAVSRMYSGSHWFSDIAFGGMLAWFCADTAIQRIQVNRFRRARASDDLSLRVFPFPGGLTLRASFK